MISLKDIYKLEKEVYIFNSHCPNCFGLNGFITPRGVSIEERKADKTHHCVYCGCEMFKKK